MLTVPTASPLSDLADLQRRAKFGQLPRLSQIPLKEAVQRSIASSYLQLAISDNNDSLKDS